MGQNDQIQLFDDSKVPNVREVAIEHLRTIIANDGMQNLEKVQNFLVLLNQSPPKTWLKKHPFVKVKNEKGQSVPYEYIPIPRIEMLLDKLYFGQWSTINFKWTQIFNEISGSIDLEVLNPVTGRIQIRTGAASIQIMQDSGAKVSDFNATKKANALETGFPKLKSECIKNAAKTLGNVFGANIGRQNEDVLYVPMINEENKGKIFPGVS